MNTKVVHHDLLNMFKLFVRSHTHFMHWSHIGLSRSTHITSLKYLIMKGDPFMNNVPFVNLSVANVF